MNLEVIRYTNNLPYCDQWKNPVKVYKLPSASQQMQHQVYNDGLILALHYHTSLTPFNFSCLNISPGAFVQLATHKYIQQADAFPLWVLHGDADRTLAEPGRDPGLCTHLPLWGKHTANWGEIIKSVYAPSRKCIIRTYGLITQLVMLNIIVSWKYLWV